MSAGIVLNKKIGDHIKKGELLATLYTNKDNTEEIYQKVVGAFKVSKTVIKKSSERLLIE